MLLVSSLLLPLKLLFLNYIFPVACMKTYTPKTFMEFWFLGPSFLSVIQPKSSLKVIFATAEYIKPSLLCLKPINGLLLITGWSPVSLAKNKAPLMSNSHQISRLQLQSSNLPKFLIQPHWIVVSYPCFYCFCEDGMSGHMHFWKRYPLLVYLAGFAHALHLCATSFEKSFTFQIKT